MTKDQLYKKEYAIQLIRIAAADLVSAKALEKVGEGRPENVCFLAQQAIEKSLKAVICHLEIAIPFSHSLELLTSLIPKDSKPPNSENLESLTEYATIRRYEEGFAKLEKADLEAVIFTAENTLHWAQKIINEKN